MKKIIIVICMVVLSLVGATVVPSGETWATYNSDLDTAKNLESKCANNGADWRDVDECKEHCVETSLSGTIGNGVRLSCDWNGVRIKEKLKLVIDIISIVIAALGVAAITFVGIRYLTAGADVGKAVKARTRLIEIMIGLVVYALIYTILNFLIPNFQ